MSKQTIPNPEVIKQIKQVKEQTIKGGQTVNK
jgi:hypothetical protein